MANKLTSNDSKEITRNWLMEDGWSLRQASPEGASWAFIAEDPHDRRIIVGQKTDREDQLVIQAVVKLDDDAISRIDQLPEDERNEFLWDLRFELLRANLDFNGVMFPLKQIEVMTRIHSDALTKDIFIQRLGQVHKGVIIIQWTLMRKFAQQPLPRQMGLQR